MKVVNGKPPNWEEIITRFQVNATRVVCTYGDTVYMVGGGEMYPDLRAHESVHIRQQREMGVEAWWSKYLVDDTFRLEQELAAYRVQYMFKQQEQKDRNKVAQFLTFIAHELSSPMYGGMVTFPQAIRLIRTGR